MVIVVLEVFGKEMGVGSPEVMKEHLNRHGLLVAQIAGGVRRKSNSSSHVVVIPLFILVFDILTNLTWIEFEARMTEAALH